MMNQTVLVGRVVDIVSLERDGESTCVKLQVAVTRSYKNNEGEYETDIIPLVLFDGIAQNTMEYVKKGDLIGARCRLECTDGDVHVLCDKISYLASRKDGE